MVIATPLSLCPRERPGTQFIRDWVGLRARLDGWFTPFSTFQETGGQSRGFCTVCHYLTVLPPPTLTHTEALETVCVTVTFRSGRCYLLFLVPYASWSSHSPQTLVMEDVLVSPTCPSVCRRGVLALTIVSPNSCLLFPTSSSPDIASDPRTVQPVASRYTVYAIPASHVIRTVQCLPCYVLSRDVL